jgi:hypothetical protein
MSVLNLVRETSEGAESQGEESDSHLAILWSTIGQWKESTAWLTFEVDQKKIILNENSVSTFYEKAINGQITEFRERCGTSW